jgi:hypothetical protein
MSKKALLKDDTTAEADWFDVGTMVGEFTSGFYSGTPPEQVNSDWNATSGVAEILNKPIEWFKRYTIPPMAVGANGSPLIWPIPLAGTLPYSGFYQVDGFIRFKEYSSYWNDNPLVHASTIGAQTFSIYNDPLGSPLRELLDVSPVIEVVGVTDPPKLYNTSLQGSAILEVTGTNVLFVKLELPNCQYHANEVLGGYVHVEYLGTTEY